jgi:hypothetical protein
LALVTGWTPDVIADLPGSFRAGCHWSLYVTAIAGSDGLPAIEAGPGQRMTPEMQAQRVAVLKLRADLYPED